MLLVGWFCNIECSIVQISIHSERFFQEGLTYGLTTKKNLKSPSFFPKWTHARWKTGTDINKQLNSVTCNYLGLIGHPFCSAISIKTRLRFLCLQRSEEAINSFPPQNILSLVYLEFTVLCVTKKNSIPLSKPYSFFFPSTNWNFAKSRWQQWRGWKHDLQFPTGE